MTILKQFVSLELQCNYNYCVKGPFVFLKIFCACVGLACFAYKNFYLLFTSISEHLLGYIVHCAFDRFCCSNHAKLRKVEISKIWSRGRLTCFVDSDCTQFLNRVPIGGRGGHTYFLNGEPIGGGGTAHKNKLPVKFKVCVGLFFWHKIESLKGLKAPWRNHLTIVRGPISQKCMAYSQM